jgi:hypothetical protein
MSTVHKTICTIVISAVGLLSSGVTVAAAHSGRVVFPEPRNPPSIGVSPPPADQTHEYDREVIIQYNASVGSVTFAAEVWDPDYWGEKYGESFSLGSKCKEGPIPVFGPREFEASVKARPREHAGRNEAGSPAKPPCAGTPAMSKARARSTANGLKSRFAAPHSATGTGAAPGFTNPA